MTRNHTPLPLLKDLSADNAAKNGDAVAFQDDTETVTWREYEERSKTAASVLAEHVSQGDRVGFYCKPSVQHAALFNGALKAGAITTNFHVRTAPASFRHCVEKAQPRVVVVDEELADSFDENVTPELLDGIDAVLTIGSPTYEYERAVQPLLDAAAPRELGDIVEELAFGRALFDGLLVEEIRELDLFLVVFGVPVPEEFSADPNQYREQNVEGRPFS